jgi:hypothetical protein
MTTEYLCARYAFTHSRLELGWSPELRVYTCHCPSCVDYDDEGNATHARGEGATGGAALADYAEQSGVPVSQLETGERHS